jgi:hypothetical protein
MAEYKVIWTIDIDAESIEGAADEALAIMTDPDSIATCFQITEKESGCRWEINGNRPRGQNIKRLPFSWAKLIAKKLGNRTDH